MPIRGAQKGDVVTYRKASGKTENATVVGAQPATLAFTGAEVTQNATGGTLGTGTFSYRISQVVDGVEGNASAAATEVIAAGATNRNIITLPGVAGVIYKVYGRTSGAELLIHTSAAGASSFSDTGSVTPSGAFIASGSDRTRLWLPSSHAYVTSVNKGVAASQYEFRY